MRIAPHESETTRASWNAAQSSLLGYPREAVPFGGGRHVEPPPISEFIGETEDPDPPHTLAVWVDDRTTAESVTESTEVTELERTALLAMLAVTKEVFPSEAPLAEVVHR
jgi:hypothetical protein